jgi:hypothetical protein
VAISRGSTKRMPERTISACASRSSASVIVEVEYTGSGRLIAQIIAGRAPQWDVPPSGFKRRSGFRPAARFCTPSEIPALRG